MIRKQEQQQNMSSDGVLMPEKDNDAVTLSHSFYFCFIKKNIYFCRLSTRMKLHIFFYIVLI